MKKTIIIISIAGIIISAGYFGLNRTVNTMPAPGSDGSINVSGPAADTSTQPQTEGSSQNLFTDGNYYDYNGTIGGMPVSMSLYASGGELKGSYYYEKYKDELTLEGNLQDGAAVLYEYDPAGSKTGMFKGEIQKTDKIKGTWISSDNSKSCPFELSLESIISAEYGKRYSIAVNENDQDVENFAREIQSYILNNDKEKLADNIHYPVNVKINGEAAEIKDKDELIRNYDEIFTTDYKKLIGDSPYKYLFVNYQGVMFAQGGIWINDVMDSENNSKLMITSINN